MSEANKTNGTQNVVNETAQAQVNTAPAAQPAPVVTQQNVAAPAPVEEKPNWFKRNWKKVAAGSAAVLTAVGSAFVAYRKGKSAGYNCAMPQQNDDYSPLDPNV